jgi:hypothetical protein
MVNFDLDPDWPCAKKYGLTQFYRSGEPIYDPMLCSKI